MKNNLRLFKGLWPPLTPKNAVWSLCTFRSVMGEFAVCVHCYNMQLRMWICMPVFYFSLILLFFHPHVFVLWLCSFFDAALPLSSACPLHLIYSDLTWPPSAREHSADPSGKVCTLDSQSNPSPCLIMLHCPESLGLHNYNLNNRLLSSLYTLLYILYIFVYFNIFIVQPYGSVPAILSTSQLPKL